MSAPRARAVVVGGGLAGVSAAVSLADRGWDTTLVEARPRLGGAAYSFDRGGLTVDTGQHVLLRGYTSYLALLRRFGVDGLVPVQERLQIPVLRPGQRPVWLRRGRRGPAPLHLLPTLAGYSLLSPAERTRVALVGAALRRVDPDDPARDAETFGGWLRRHGTGPRAVSRFWGLFCVAALNIAPDDASLALAARVFRSGLLEDVRAGDLAVPRVPLSHLHDAPAQGLLRRCGVRCVLGERVLAVDADHDGAMTVRTRTGDVAASAVVLAVPHQRAARVVPTGSVAAPERWAELGASPIVNVHVRYDRVVTRLPFAAAVDSPVQWVFDRTAATGADDGQYLVVSLSAADTEATQPARQVLATQLVGLAALFPRAHHARVVDAFVTREPAATFRQRAGSAALRPPAATLHPGLALAGAWTATGWPDTMEGAVRSGSAAAAVLGHPDRSRRSVEAAA